jgi:hypothetical protein
MTGAAGAAGAAGVAGSQGAKGDTGPAGLAGVNGSDAIPYVQYAKLAFNVKNQATLSTKVEVGSSYQMTITVQAKASNLLQTAQLKLLVSLAAKSGGTLTQILSIPSTGINAKGEIVQTTQITGVFTPSAAAESVSVSAKDLDGRTVRSLSAVVQLVKIKLQVVSQSETAPSLKATPSKKATALKAAAAKAAALKAAAAKAAAKVTGKK